MFEGKIVRLSHTLTKDTPSYGNRDTVRIKPNTSISHGDSSNTSVWGFSSNHIGTHIDVPRHFCETGMRTFDLPVDDFIFKNVQFIEIPCQGSKLISVLDIQKVVEVDVKTELLLIRTGFESFRSENKYWNDNPGLAAELAEYLRINFQNLRCVGFDFISLTSWKERSGGAHSHRAFLCPEKGIRPILIIEDMSLEIVRGTILWTIVSPLYVDDGNGGPVTVFAGIE